MTDIDDADRVVVVDISVPVGVEVDREPTQGIAIPPPVLLHPARNQSGGTESAAYLGSRSHNRYRVARNAEGHQAVGEAPSLTVILLIHNITIYISISNHNDTPAQGRPHCAALQLQAVFPSIRGSWFKRGVGRQAGS